jgi:Kef-type K+ transport system membrane component KefB
VIDVDTGSFFAIVMIAAIAAVTVAVLPRAVAPPVVVLELFMGILIGPHVLGLAHSSDFIEFFSNLGLGMLFFFAGYEIDFERIRGRPMKLGAWGWLLSVKLAWRGWPALERTFEASSQLAVRITVVLVFGLVLLASKLGLDVLLGGFVAGMITRMALKGHELHVFESKLTAVGFGFFVPFFFVTSGIEFDLSALGSTTAILKLVMFFVLFLIVRGAPALLLYRNVFSLRDRGALAFYSATELPLVVAITTIAIDTGHMKASTAAGLVGAAMLSTLVFPFVGLALRKRSEAEEPDEPPAGAAQAPAIA